MTNGRWWSIGLLESVICHLPSAIPPSAPSNLPPRLQDLHGQKEHECGHRQVERQETDVELADAGGVYLVEDRQVLERLGAAGVPVEGVVVAQQGQQDDQEQDDECA